MDVDSYDDVVMMFVNDINAVVVVVVDANIAMIGLGCS